MFQGGLSRQCNSTGYYGGWGLHSGSHCRENLCVAGKKCKVFELINVKNFLKKKDFFYKPSFKKFQNFYCTSILCCDIKSTILVPPTYKCIKKQK